MSDLAGAQRDIARIALEASRDAGFVLAGSGAIREHGLSHRPTEDIDLFTTQTGTFGDAVEHVVGALRAAGYAVEQTRRSSAFCRLAVSGPAHTIEVDMGVDWRKNDPAQLEIGPVLSIDDAVGNKVAALFSRGEPRDYLDVDTIRRTGRFTDDELIAAAAERDLGSDLRLFVESLRRGRLITMVDVERYGVTAGELGAVVDRMQSWATELANTHALQDEPGFRMSQQGTTEA